MQNRKLINVDLSECEKSTKGKLRILSHHVVKSDIFIGRLEWCILLYTTLLIDN